MSNTIRSRDLLRERGYAVDVCESYNFYTKRRKDLFGIFDLIGVGPDGTVVVQTTSKSNLSSREKKIAESEFLPFIRAANWTILLHGWFKNKSGRWECKEVDVS